MKGQLLGGPVQINGKPMALTNAIMLFNIKLNDQNGCYWVCIKYG